jgi:hypothetical protein
MIPTARKARLISSRKAKLAMIHVAKKECGLDDDGYRELLKGAIGVGSAAQIKYEYEFDKIMRAFETLGFKITTNTGAKKGRPRWTEEWGGTQDQRAKIEVLWKAVARNKTDHALRLFIKRIAKVDHPRFLNTELARNVILALEAMARKAKKREGVK